MDRELQMIVERALAEKQFQGLLDDWVKDRWEELEGDIEGLVAFERKFGIMNKERDIELAFQKFYVPLFRRLWGASASEALDALDYDSIRMPNRNVPMMVIKLIAEALAKRDAAEAETLREMARAKGW